jgi:hypothetical protein
MRMIPQTAGLLIAGISLAAACGVKESSSTSPSATNSSSQQSSSLMTLPAKVTSVRVFIKDGRPQAYVQGEVGDGCASLVPPTQARKGNVIDLNLDVQRPSSGPCTMILQLLDRWIDLDGTFTPGEYTLNAEAKSVTFKLIDDGNGLRVEPDPGPLPRPR